MGKSKEMCPYQTKSWNPGTPRYESWRHGIHPPVKRKRVKCPECGRRLWAWISIDHDGAYASFMIPPHKKKKWWKKEKKKRKEKKRRRKS